MAEWRLQIYLVSDQISQELIAGLLAGIDSLVVESISGDFDHFVVVESSDNSQAEALPALIGSIDPGAMLIHTSTAGPVEPSAA